MNYFCTHTHFSCSLLWAKSNNGVKDYRMICKWLEPGHCTKNGRTVQGIIHYTILSIHSFIHSFNIRVRQGCIMDALCRSDECLICVHHIASILVYHGRYSQASLVFTTQYLWNYHHRPINGCLSAWTWASGLFNSSIQDLSNNYINIYNTFKINILLKIN